MDSQRNWDNLKAHTFTDKIKYIKQWGTGEMAQWIKCLWSKYKDSSLEPRKYVRNSTMAFSCSTELGEGTETERSLKNFGQSLYLNWWDSGSLAYSLPQNKSGEQYRKYIWSHHLASTWTPRNMHVYQQTQVSIPKLSICVKHMHAE